MRNKNDNDDEKQGEESWICKPKKTRERDECVFVTRLGVGLGQFETNKITSVGLLRQ